MSPVCNEVKAEARKAKLPDFWLPSLTPEARTTVLDYKDLKLQTLCNATSPAHPLTLVPFCILNVLFNDVICSLKSLVPVNFTLETSSANAKPTKICPCCKKELTNSTLIICERYLYSSSASIHVYSSNAVLWTRCL